MKIIDKAFVLQRTSYSETSYVVKCFTKNHGLKSFLIQGAKKKYANLIQSLSPIEFTYTFKNEEQLAKMYDVSFFYQPTSIQNSTKKTSIIFFQNEVLKNVIFEGEIDKQLFEFIFEEYCWLNENENLSNYIIYWLFQLIVYLGFDPKEIQENDFSYLGSKTLFNEFKSFSKNDVLTSTISKEIRAKIIEVILQYYKEKIPNFNSIKSLEVFHTIWYE